MHPTRHAQTRPDHPALIMAGSGTTVTFAQMEARANQVAHLLRARGLQAGDVFAVLLENGPLYFDLFWGMQRSGCLMVPVPTRLTAPEIAYLLADSGAKLLVTQAQFDPLIPALHEAQPDLAILRTGADPAADTESFDIALAAMPDQPIADPSVGAPMLYSSGTTGQPKGVYPAPPASPDVEAPTPLLGLATMGTGMPSDGSIVYLSPAPLYHAAPLAWATTVQRLGGTVVVMEKFDPEAALAAIERFAVTDSQWVPTHFVRMLKLPEAVRSRYDLSSHQRAIHAAAPCPVAIKRAMIDWWGPILLEYYAGSEGIGMTLLNSEQWLAHPGSVGPAIYGTVHVCGPDGAELGPDEDGLIYFENPVLPSYHNDPEKTAKALHAKGWMTLGDIGHLDADGYLYLTDRQSHMIISGGVNIYPQEVENLLIAHPKVMDAAVIGVPEPDLGEQVTAVVQPVEEGALEGAGADALETELRAYLDGQLSHIKMPRRYVFRPDLPREANGKLYKRALRDEFAAEATNTT